ncbi:putative phosphotransferase involved in extracellular matrix synthesis (fragment) [Nostocoides australiense Ben110]|uniref:Putative phosphotransferase involved in extracellular matrix synthesis n=1 Tax=Nostocoides australiense Ben110 TaxID=1193182 RepID=W6JWQ7_9MICO
MHYLPLYTPEQARRHNVRPGMTGLAQVSGRNTLTWEQRLRLDVEYVDGRSARGDAKILKKTIGSVLRREGISGAGVATMAEFTGTQSEKNQ